MCLYGTAQCRAAFHNLSTDATIPPTIVVQSLVVVHLPQHLVILNASQSHDDFGISSYQWIPHPQNSVIGVSTMYFYGILHSVYVCACY